MTPYLIVGGSAAGMAAACRIREIEPAAPVTILSAEDDLPYFRPLIPFCLSGRKTVEEISLLNNGPYQAKNLDIRTSSRVIHLDSSSKFVTLENGTTLSYHKLLIATGSRPRMVQEVEGLKNEGVYTLRTLADTREMAERSKKSNQAVMLGGGMLNLKTAFALLERGIGVTLAVYSPEVLSQLMEPEDASLIRQALEYSGLHIITGVNCRKILGGDDGVTGVELDNGETLSCQMVCIGKGVTPNIEWLNESGLQLENGVVVDQYTRSSQGDIFGAGDVAVTYDPISNDPIVTGLWTNAVEMGRCAGANMAGRATRYGGTFGILNATQVARMPFVSMGIVHTSGTNLPVDKKATADSYRKLVFSEDRKYLLGAVFVGDITRAGLYRTLIREKLPVDHLHAPLRNETLHYGNLLLRSS